MTQHTKTDASSGFWSGFTSIFSFFGVQRWPAPPHISSRGFLSDWMALSQDFRRVVERFEEGRTDGQAWAQGALDNGAAHAPRQHRAHV